MSRERAAAGWTRERQPRGGRGCVWCAPWLPARLRRTRPGHRVCITTHPPDLPRGVRTADIRAALGAHCGAPCRRAGRSSGGGGGGGGCGAPAGEGREAEQPLFPGVHPAEPCAAPTCPPAVSQRLPKRAVGSRTGSEVGQPGGTARSWDSARAGGSTAKRRRRHEQSGGCSCSGADPNGRRLARPGCRCRALLPRAGTSRG